MCVPLEVGLERCVCGFPLHEIDHLDRWACAGGPSAFIFVPSMSAHHLIRCLWRKSWVHFAVTVDTCKLCCEKTFVHQTATMYAQLV